MATWQVVFYLIKKSIDCSSDIISEDSLAELGIFFGEEKSWCNAIRQFGKIDSTCLEIFSGDTEMTLRIDLRSITKEQLNAICGFTKKNGFMIKFENELQEPSFQNFITIIKKSNALQFLKNVDEYLSQTNIVN